MNKFLKSSISTKLKAIIVLVSSFILICSSIFIVLNEYKTLENDLIYNSVLNSKLIGEYCVPTLLFDDKKGCYEILSKSEPIPFLSDVTIYDNNNDQFARFERNITTAKNRMKNIHLFRDTIFTEVNILNVVKTIFYENNKYGIIHLRASYEIINNKITGYITLMAVLILITIIVTYILASNL